MAGPPQKTAALRQHAAAGEKGQPRKRDGTIIYKHAYALGCEGIVSKRLGWPYRSGRADRWVKIRACFRGGFEPASGTPIITAEQPALGATLERQL